MFSIQAGLKIKHLGLQEYTETWHAMQAFTLARQPDTWDEIWTVEHYPVFTQGQAGKAEHVLNPGSIPVVQTDRGGQITYHGPGQLVVYFLLDLKRKNFTVRQLVTHLEHMTIELLASYKVTAYAKPEAPGIYVAGAKIASLGLRIKRGCCYHGLALNINMDLEPFTRINPCGFKNLQMTQLATCVPQITVPEVQERLVGFLKKQLQYGF